MNQNSQHKNEQSHRNRTNWFKVVWDLLGSMKFGIGVLIVLALLAVIGALLPQNAPDPVYLGRFGPVLTGIILGLGFDSMYGSVLFVGTAALMALSMAACTTRRLRILARPIAPPDPKLLEFDFDAYSLSQSSPALAPDQNRIGTGLKSAGFKRHKIIPTPDGCRFWAMKGAAHGWGSFLIHVTIFVIFIGVMVGKMGGDAHYLSIAEGAEFEDLQGRFTLRLQNFVARFDEKGSPIDYRSELEILDHGQVAKAGTIRVNHPLKYRGLYFFQSGYRLHSAEFNIRVGGRDHASLTLYPEDEGGAMAVTEDEFLPDENDPMVKLYLYDYENDVWRSELISLSHPIELGGATIELESVRTRSIIQIKRDPGLPIIWAGFGILLVGLVLTFYVSQTEIFGSVEKRGENGDGHTFTLAGRFGGIPVEAEANFKRTFDYLKRFV